MEQGAFAEEEPEDEFEGAIYHTQDDVIRVAVCASADKSKPFDGQHIIFQDTSLSERELWRTLERVAQERGICLVALSELSN